MNPSPVRPRPTTDLYAASRLAANLAQAARGGADIVFLGDSITEGWTSQGAGIWMATMVPRRAADFGIGGDTTGDLLSRIAAGELTGKPKVVVLMIGTNNLLLGNTPAQVVEGVNASLAAIRAATPQSQVVLMGLTPINRAGSPSLNRKVTTVNAMIAGLVDGTTVHYVDMSRDYLLPDGLPNQAMFADTVHPSSLGYAAWARSIGGLLDTLTGRQATRPALPVPPIVVVPTAPLVPVSLTPPPAPPPTFVPRRHGRLR